MMCLVCSDCEWLKRYLCLVFYVMQEVFLKKNIFFIFLFSLIRKLNSMLNNFMFSSLFRIFINFSLYLGILVCLG